MRELERDLPAKFTAPEAPAAPARLTIVGAGRVGGSIGTAAGRAGIEVAVVGRDATFTVADPTAEMVLLAVPDDAIAAVAEGIARAASGAPVGHVSGATTLEALAPAAGAGSPLFSLHPLQTVPTPETDLTGAPCAIAGSDERITERARGLAVALGMRPFEVPEEKRAAYHAAAAIASNFLVALEESAAELLAAAGVEDPREVLAPLVLRSAANWSDLGADALTGPIARGDQATVAAHRQALAEIAPDLLPLYETLAERTMKIAGGAR